MHEKRWIFYSGSVTSMPLGILLGVNLGWIYGNFGVDSKKKCQESKTFAFFLISGSKTTFRRTSWWRHEYEYRTVFGRHVGFDFILGDLYQYKSLFQICFQRKGPYETLNVFEWPFLWRRFKRCYPTSKIA